MTNVSKINRPGEATPRLGAQRPKGDKPQVDVRQRLATIGKPDLQLKDNLRPDKRKFIPQVWELLTCSLR
jgi:hypothetical protein